MLKRHGGILDKFTNLNETKIDFIKIDGAQSQEKDITSYKNASFNQTFLFNFILEQHSELFELLPEEASHNIDNFLRHMRINFEKYITPTHIAPNVGDLIVFKDNRKAYILSKHDVMRRNGVSQKLYKVMINEKIGLMTLWEIDNNRNLTVRTQEIQKHLRNARNQQTMSNNDVG